MNIRVICLLLVLTIVRPSCSQGQNSLERRVGRLRELFAWRQLTYNIEGNMLTEDRFDEIDSSDLSRSKRQVGEGRSNVFFNESEVDPERDWNQRPPTNLSGGRPNLGSQNQGRPQNQGNQGRPQSQGGIQNQGNPGIPQNQGNQGRPQNHGRPQPQGETSTTTVRPQDESERFFVQYNNIPMGAERVGDRLFITVPRRRYGIPSTLNYIDINEDSNNRSPALRPYPDFQQSRGLVSVYRTRADRCGRLWMVDTGLLEIPDNRQQVQPPAIVVYDLNTNRQILRYPFKSTDLPSANTPTGLSSITVDIGSSCEDAFAYVPDLATYGLIVFSLSENDSWRLAHNYFSFNPTAGQMSIAGQRFQWNDGIFSVTLTDPLPQQPRCRVAYFHPMVGTNEFSVSTCVLKNRTASEDSNFWRNFALVGDRGENSQSTMHGYHSPSNVLFFADIARSGISCWNAGRALNPSNIAILAEDNVRISYPADLHVTDDEVWVMANSLPRWIYSRLDTNQYNFFVYRANVQELISGTVCENRNFRGS